jgi:cytoskeleton protein RodZ
VTIFQRIRTPFTEPAAVDQTGSQPQMRMVGDLLQERREDLGLDLEEIGAMLRIKPAYLAALEQGRTRDLPGAAYAIGFLRAYADFLGLNAGQVMARFKAEASGVTARPDLALPVPLDERSLPGRALVLVALILALCGYGIWYYLSTEDRNRPEHVAAVPAALQTPAPPVSAPPAAPPSLPTADAPAPNPPAAAAPAPAQLPPKQVTAAANAPPAFPPVAQKPPPGTAQPAPAPPAVAQKPPPAAAPQLAAVAPPAASATLPPPAAAAATPVATGAGRISIRALADCWIQIRSADQSIVFSRVLRSGEVYNVPVRSGLSLRTGNAGVLEIAVDGKPAPSIGGIGTLRRDVALDPAELAAGHAVHG